MRATLWILHDSTTQLAFTDVDVPREGINRPPEYYTLAVYMVPGSKISLSNFLNDSTSAQFRLFDMIGWEPAVHAHYLLQNRPETGWMWIVHPSRPRLILARSLHPA